MLCLALLRFIHQGKAHFFTDPKEAAHWANTLGTNLKHIKLDPNGCFVVLVLELRGKPHTMTNIYVPPSFTKKFFEKVMGMILEIAEGP